MVEKTEKAVFHPEKNNTLKISPFFDWKKPTLISVAEEIEIY